MMELHSCFGGMTVKPVRARQNRGQGFSPLPVSANFTTSARVTRILTSSLASISPHRPLSRNSNTVRDSVVLALLIDVCSGAGSAVVMKSLGWVCRRHRR